MYTDPAKWPGNMQGINVYECVSHCQNIPGPGKYEIRGQFDGVPPKVNTEGIEVEHPPFMSQSKVSWR